MALEIKVDTKKLQRAFDAGPAELTRALKAQGFEIGKRYIGFHRAQRLRGNAGGKGVRGTRKGLLSAFRSDTSGTTLDSLRLDIYTPSYVARQHERGESIRATKGKYLAVPFSSLSKAEARTAKQLLDSSKRVPEFSSIREAAKAKLGRRRADRLFFIRSGGKIFFAERKDRKGGRRSVKLLFHLERKVQLKRRLDFRELWNTSFRPTAIKLYNKGIGFALAAIRKKAASGQ